MIVDDWKSPSEICSKKIKGGHVEDDEVRDFWKQAMLSGLMANRGTVSVAGCAYLADLSVEQFKARFGPNETTTKD